MNLFYLALVGRILLLGVERIVVKKLATDEDAAAANFLFLGLASLFLLPMIYFYEIPPLDFIIYPAMSALIYSVGFFLYVKALSIEEASLVSPLYNFNLFFILIISSLFLDESFTIFKIAGITILFYGSAFLNKQKNLLQSLKAVFNNKGCRLMITCSLLVTFGRVIDGFSVKFNIHAVPYVIAVSIFVLIYCTTYILATKKMPIAIDLFKRKYKIAITCGLVNAFSYLFLVIAFMGVDVSIAEPLTTLSMIVTLILSKIYFKELIGTRMKGVLIMIVGAWILFL